MRPLELELEGFTSFRRRTQVSFEGLDLFAITGPTGAGKTSLLDAMIFALYGRTPRLGREVSQLVSRGLKHMRVRLDFAVGERRYRVVRTSKMLPKSMQSESQLEEVGEGQPKFLAAKAGDVEETITHLIGLDFDSFIRSVVLPQGDFDLFLKGEPKERQRILHHLLRMHIYERVRKLAEERAGSHGQECRLLEVQVRELGEATAESLAASREALARLQAQSTALDARLREVEKAEAKAASLVQELGKAAEARAEGAQLAVERKTLEAKLAAIAAREAASARIRAELEERLARNLYDEARHLALEKCEAEARGRREAEAVRARAAAETAAAATKIAEIEKKLADAEKDLRRAGRKVAQATEAADKARATRDDLVRRFGSAARVASHLAMEDNRLRMQLQRREKDAARAAATDELERVVKALATAQDAEAKAVAARDEANAAFEEVQRAGAALALRQHLHRGERCPVCEQPVAKVPAKRKLADLEQKRTALKDATRRASTCVQKTAGLAAKLEAERSRIMDIERDHKHLGEAEDSCAAKLESYLGAPPDAGTHGRLARAQANCERTEKALESATVTLQATEREAVGARQRRDTEAAELATESKACELHERQLAEIDRAVVEMRARIAAVVGESSLDPIRGLEHALAGSRQAKADREAIRKEMESAAERRATDRDEATSSRAVLAELEKKRVAVKYAGDRAERRAAQARAHLAEAAGALEIALPESVTGEAERQAVARRLAELREAQVELAGDRALAARETERIAADIEKRTGLMSKVAELGAQEKVARDLARHLQPNHFVAYLVGEALEVLAADASRHLRDFPGGSFSLAVEGQDFTVIDHANADQKRSVKTLSGGESFNAALALAVTFAESLADLAGSGGGQPAALESLFLDEGFGTLDAENLDAVAGAIEALYGRGRTVGIISHMPELAQRMPVRIVVTKEGNASRVEVESG